MKKTLFILAASMMTFSVNAQNAAETAEYVEGQISSFLSLAIQAGFLVGVVLFLSGLYLLYKDSQQQGQGHAKKGFIALAVGSALLMSPTLMDVGSSSIIDGEEAQLEGY